MKFKFTKMQLEALLKVYNRQERMMSYLSFRRSAFLAFGNCLMINVGSMTLGIEIDGHTHS